VGADDKIAVKLIKFVVLLGLPDQDYYSSQEKDTKEKRDKYEQHIARMLQFIERLQCKPKQVQLRALEIKMSNPRLDRVERRDGRLQYNPMTIAELQKMTPAIN
jgi:endothelin-converting enzyme/putative endopeptidase